MLHLGVPPHAFREAKAVAIDGQSLEIVPYQSADGELQSIWRNATADGARCCRNVC